MRGSSQHWQRSDSRHTPRSSWTSFRARKSTGFFGDISRTVVRGNASDRLKHAYHCVEQGQKIGFRRIRNGANAYDIHGEILEYFNAQGFPTGVIDGRMQGFFHGTGHGLGLDIHEAPGIGMRSKNNLKTGHVVTVEPGLYYQGMGGVRSGGCCFCDGNRLQKPRPNSQDS